MDQTGAYGERIGWEGRGPREWNFLCSLNCFYCSINCDNKAMALGDLPPFFFLEITYLAEALTKVKYYKMEMLSVALATREWITVSKKGIHEEELEAQIDLLFILLGFFFDFKLTFKLWKTWKYWVAGVFMLFSTIQSPLTAFITTARFKCAYLKVKIFSVM